MWVLYLQAVTETALQIDVWSGKGEVIGKGKDPWVCFGYDIETSQYFGAQDTSLSIEEQDYVQYLASWWTEYRAGVQYIGDEPRFSQQTDTGKFRLMSGIDRSLTFVDCHVEVSIFLKCVSIAADLILEQVLGKRTEDNRSFLYVTDWSSNPLIQEPSNLPFKHPLHNRTLCITLFDGPHEEYATYAVGRLYSMRNLRVVGSYGIELKANSGSTILLSQDEDNEIILDLKECVFCFRVEILY